MILSPWFDRPLSVAGRLIVRQDGKIREKMVTVDRDLLVIPNLAIHMNREVNDGYKYCLLYTSGGKSNIIRQLEQRPNEEGTILVIVDGAAFGSEMKDISECIKTQGNLSLIHIFTKVTMKMHHPVREDLLRYLQSNITA